MAVKAIGKNISISPKKLQHVVALVRGKPVSEALEILRFMPSPAAAQVSKVVSSAAANAENNLMMARDGLYIVGIAADKAGTLKRYRPAPRGRMARIIKRSSHITVTVDEGGR